jgi:hypothetical protein
MLTPRIVYGTISGDGSPPLPATIGATQVYSERHFIAGVALPYFDHLHIGAGGLDIRLCVALIAQVDSTHAVWCAWSPNAPADVSRWGALVPALRSLSLISSVWLCDADGLGISAVEADAGADAAAVMAAWPAAWRYWAAGDVRPDPIGGVVGSGPSGARCLPGSLA